MNRSWIYILFIVPICSILVGCESPNPNAGFAPDPKAKAKASVQVAPGPVDADAPAEFTTTESGLKYRIRRKSDGQKPTPESKVQVHYRGQLDNGKIFDTSYGKTGGAIEFNVKGVIAGWTEGLQLIGEGGMVELEIPPKLGYGTLGKPPVIPPEATLHFLVELLSVR